MICRAAVKIIDYKQNGKEIIIPCHRHCDAFKILYDFGYTAKDYKQLSQGFLNEHDKYLTRIEAMQEARKCNQLIIEPEYNELFSEDVW